MWSSWLAAMVLAAAPASVSPDVIDRVYREIAPAVCLVNYSSEVTNPNSGETNKLDTRALGVIVSADGLVMVHGHMKLDNSDPFNIRVLVGEGDAATEYTAKLLRKPDDINVCFLRIESETPLTLPTVRFSEPPTLKLGDPIVLIGLLGPTLDFRAAVQERRIGAILDKPRTTYCLDEPIPFGYVGGPVIDSDGQVIGVVGYDLSVSEGGNVYVRSGHPLLFQTSLFAKYVDSPPTDAAEDEPSTYAWLGVFTQPLTDDLAQYWALPADGGVVLSTIVPGAPADQAGLRRGDVIIGFNGIPVRAKRDHEVLQFTKLVMDSGVDAPVSVRLLREGKLETVDVKLVPRPRTTADAEEYEDEVFGLTVREITTDLRMALNLSDEVNGVIVRRVKSGGWAQLGGIRPGVIILGFGMYPVRNLEEFEMAVKKAAEEKPKEVAVFGRAGAQTGFFRLEPVWESSE